MHAWQLRLQGGHEAALLLPQVHGVDNVRSPSGGTGSVRPEFDYDTYCTVTAGHSSHRTRLIEQSVSPVWSEEFVFDSASLSSGPSVLSFQVFLQGLLRDELLLHGQLEVGPPLLRQQQSLQDAAQPGRKQRARLALPASGCECASGGDTPHPPAAVETPGFVSAVTEHAVTLLAATQGDGSSSRSVAYSTSSGALAAWSSSSAAARSRARQRQSTALRAVGTLRVSMWWVQHPSQSRAGELCHPRERGEGCCGMAAPQQQHSIITHCLPRHN